MHPPEVVNQASVLEKGEPSVVMFGAHGNVRRGLNPPTPVERVDGSPQLGLPLDLLSKPKNFGAAIFWAWCAGCPKPLGTRDFSVLNFVGLPKSGTRI